MKSKSVKVRTLLTVKALFKHSDSTHHMDATKLNKYLSPYGLDCTPASLRDTIRAMREFGIDVRANSTSYENRGLWIEKRPITNDILRQIEFALSTNPYVPADESSKIMQAFEPFVSVYQEHLLNTRVQPNFKQMNSKLMSAYSTAVSTIEEKGDLCYRTWDKKYNGETKEVVLVKNGRKYMTPRHIYQTEESIYVVGYCPKAQRVEAIDLQKSDITRSLSKKDRSDICAWLDTIDPADYVPKHHEHLIYKGPVEFIYNKRYLPELIELFGQPTTPPPKDPHHNSIFRVAEAKITNQTLSWLLSIPKNGVQIKGPLNLKNAIKDYMSL